MTGGRIRRLLARRQDPRHRRLGQDGQALGRGDRGVERPRRRAHRPVLGVAFSPDGKTLASSAALGRRRPRPPPPGRKLWDVAGRRELATLPGHPDRVFSSPSRPTARRSPRGASTGRSGSGTATDGDRGASTAPAVPDEPQVVLALAYSPDGKILATAGEDTAIRLRDVASRGLLRTSTGHDDAVAALAFTPDGKTLASGGYDKRQALGRRHGPRARDAQGHKNWVFAVAFSPDGKTLASGGYDKIVKLWDVAGPRSWRRSKGTRRPSARSPSRPTARPSPRAAATGRSSSGTSAGAPGAVAPEGAQGGGPRRRVLARRQDARLGGRGPHGQALGRRHRARSGPPSRATPTWSAASAFSPTGRTLAVGRLGHDRSSSGTSPPARSGSTPHGPHRRVAALAFAPDGRQLATGGLDKQSSSGSPPSRRCGPAPRSQH